MSHAFCRQEQNVIAAVRSGIWSDALREHANHCMECADIIVVTEFLQSEAELAGADATLPSAESVWWKAQLAARRKALARTTRPLDLVWSLGISAGLATAFWYVLGLSHTQSLQWPIFEGPFAEAVIFGGGASLIFLLFGALYLARSE